MDITYVRDGPYQYEVVCRWADGPLLCWVLLNPSSGDRVRQPTRDRCIRFAKAWGFGGIVQRNRFAYRATNPRELLTVADPHGDNTAYLARLGSEPLTVAAWGSHPAIRRACDLPSLEWWCIGVNRDGQPRHPLHAPARVELQKLPSPTWRPAPLSFPG